MGGYTFITEFDGKLYALQGGLGGIPDAYGQPTKIIIANPYLEFYKELDIEEDGVLIRNDDLMTGVLPLYERFNTLLVENDINMLLHGYGTRMKTLISASDDGTKESADLYMKKLIDGQPSIIGESSLFDGITVHSGGEGSSASSLIEMTQYLKASLYSEVGISTNFNMKKARLIVDEVEQQQDGAFPYVYSMMKNRLVAVKKINEKYGTDIKVDFGSIWNIQNRRFVDDIIEEGLAEELIPRGYDEYDDYDIEDLIIKDEEDPTLDISTETVEEVIDIEDLIVDDEVNTLLDNEETETQVIQPIAEELIVEEEIEDEIEEEIEEILSEEIEDDIDVDIEITDEEIEDDIDVDIEITDEDELVAEILSEEPVETIDEIEEILSEELEVEEPVIDEIINAIEEIQIDDELEEVVIDTPDEESSIVITSEDDVITVTEIEDNINSTDTEEKEKNKDDTE